MTGRFAALGLVRQAGAVGRQRERVLLAGIEADVEDAQIVAGADHRHVGQIGFLERRAVDRDLEGHAGRHKVRRLGRVIVETAERPLGFDAGQIGDELAIGQIAVLLAGFVGDEQVRMHRPDRRPDTVHCIAVAAAANIEP